MSLAEDNHLKGIPGLCKLLEVNFATLALASIAELGGIFMGNKPAIPYRKGIDDSNFLHLPYTERSLRPHITPIELPLHGLCTYSRICVLCMRQGAFVPSIFNNPLTLICPDHDSLLYDECAHCGTALSYLRSRRNYCAKCRVDLRSFADERPGSFIDRFYSEFTPWRSRYRSGRYLDEYQIAQFVLTIYVQRRGEASKSRYPHVRRRHIDVLEFLMFDWPDGFLDFLSGIPWWRCGFFQHENPWFYQDLRSSPVFDLIENNIIWEPSHVTDTSAPILGRVDVVMEAACWEGKRVSPVSTTSE